MTLDYSTEGEVKVDMVDYVKEMVSEFPEELKKIRSAYPANGHLFDTNKGSKLDDLRADIFHAVVAKALFLTMRARPDIRLTVAFLCTRVKEPTSFDWGKLSKMMAFLQETKNDSLTLVMTDPTKVVCVGVPVKGLKIHD